MQTGKFKWLEASPLIFTPVVENRIIQINANLLEFLYL